MPRNMSFALTTPQFNARTKSVTRRLGWGNLKPGDIVMGVEKGMGLKKGEKVKKLGLIKIVSVRKEPLHKITDADVVLEGFPNHNRESFMLMFMRHNKCKPDTEVNRIEYEYLDNEVKPAGMVLTGKAIRDLAEFAGFEIVDSTPHDEDMLETELYIREKTYILDDDNQRHYYNHVACYYEYPDEGWIGLGDEIKDSV